MSIAEKNPVLVAAGRRGAIKRWGDAPKTVRIDDLEPDQRRVIVALIDAARSEAAKAAPADASAGAATRNGGHGNGTPIAR